MIELLKDTHELELVVKKKRFLFRYNDATLRELIEFRKMIDEDLNLSEWLFKFLKEHYVKHGIIKLGFSRRLFNKINQYQINLILSEVVDKWSAGMYGKEQEEKKVKKDDDFFTQEANDPDSALIMKLVEKSNETLDSLLDKTWRTVKYMLEGIVWNIRSETEEGQKKNMQEAARKNAKENGIDANALLRDRLEKLKDKRKREEELGNNIN